MTILKYESKIIGVNLFWVSALLVGVYIAVCATGGDLVNWSWLGFEVIFPFYAAVAVGEWGKTRSDPMFEGVAAQSKSLFGWIVRRYLYLFLVTLAFATIGMLAVGALKNEAPFTDLFLVYLAPAFFLSTVSAAASLLSPHEHMGTMVCGVIWLFAMLAKSLLRFFFVPYVYLFARYAGVSAPLWYINKTVLLLLGLALWAGVFLLCRIKQSAVF